MVRHIHYNLNANEDFVVCFTSKLIYMLYDIHSHAFGFTLRRKFSQLLIY